MEHYTFKTADELGIPGATRDGLIQVMLDLRSGALPWEHNEWRGNPQGFNMSLHNSGGGGPSCIVGWLERRGQLNRRKTSLHHLEYPTGNLSGGLEDIGPHEAAMAIQVYLETGDRHCWESPRVAAAREVDHAPQH